MNTIFTAILSLLTIVTCPEGVPASGRPREPDRKTGKLFFLNIKSLSGPELVATCSKLLSNADANRDLDEWNAQIRGTVFLLRRMHSAEAHCVLKEVLDHPEVAPSVKADALRALCRLTADVTMAKPWLTTDEEHLRSAALELLAPQYLGDPWFDQILNGIKVKERGYSQTLTSKALRYIDKLQEFKRGYDAEEDLSGKRTLLVTAIPWLCSEPPQEGDAEWPITDGAFSQFLLMEFRRMVGHQGISFVEPAIMEYAVTNPHWKRLTESLLKVLRSERL